VTRIKQLEREASASAKRAAESDAARDGAHAKAKETRDELSTEVGSC
jgi:hypothetical protein